MTTPAIEFGEVTKVYRRRLLGQEVAALTGVSFQVSRGEVCAFLGPNGAGKTTSISILMGFIYADSGAIRVLDYEPGDIRAKAQIGFLPENFAFYKYMRAEKLLRFHHALAGGKKEGAAEAISELLRKVKLEAYEGLKIAKYSRGMVQRLGLAQALLGDPQLLVLDEPTSGLDPAGRKEVRDIMFALKAAGKTVFLSSHLLSEAEQICDRVVFIDRGRLLQTGLMSELLSAGGQVEILADRVPPELEALVREAGGSVGLVPGERGAAGGVRIVVAAARKREVAEKLWAAGCDVIRLAPLKSSLEDVYMKVMGGEAAAAEPPASPLGMPS
ncbi:MAG TPA: ABC transporter ATP-binding protein [Methylomirabilota bacterium]|nr:ABC transporter ATP-binding protein [Methylomirabilota bacterium]